MYCAFIMLSISNSKGLKNYTVFQPGQETSDISILLRDLENICNEIKVSGRKVRPILAVYIR